jgi:hypothetical protein
MIGILDIIDRIDTPNSEENFDFFKQLSEKAEKITGYRKTLFEIYRDRIGGRDYYGNEANYGAHKMLQAIAMNEAEKVNFYFIQLSDGELIMVTDTVFSMIIGITIQV